MVSSPIEDRAAEDRLRLDCAAGTAPPGEPASVVDLRLFCPLRAVGDACTLGCPC